MITFVGPWWHWVIAGAASAAIVGFFLWLTVRDARRERKREANMKAAHETLDRLLARTWRSGVSYDVTEDPDRAVSIRGALDRHESIARGLTPEQIHMLCDIADKMRAENKNGVSDDS